MTHLSPLRSHAPHRQSLLLPFPELVSELTGEIGRKLTAYITGTKDVRAIDRWIAGVRPYGEAEQRLRFAYQVVMTLRMKDKPQVVQAWLMGVNPDPGDRTAIVCSEKIICMSLARSCWRPQKYSRLEFNDPIGTSNCTLSMAR